jgi:hypothetical protein
MKNLLELKPSLNENFGWEPMPDGSVVYSFDSSQIITLNPIAELILSFCDGESTVQVILQNVRTELEDPDLSEETFLKAIDELLKQNVLLVQPS